MDTYRTVMTKRDTRRFSPAPIPAAIVDKILNAGRMAGSARAAEPFRLVVLQDPEVRKDFAWDPAWVGKVTAPTLLLWTDHDPTGGLDEAAMLLDWLPDARLYVIAVMFGWWMVDAIFGVEMQLAQSSVGNTFDSRIILPPTLASFSTSRTL